MQALLSWLVLVTFLENVSISDQGFEAEIDLDALRLNRLDDWIDHRKQQRSLNNTRLGLKSADPSKQILLTNLKRQWLDQIRTESSIYKKNAWKEGNIEGRTYSDVIVVFWLTL